MDPSQPNNPLHPQQPQEPSPQPGLPPQAPQPLTGQAPNVQEWQPPQPQPVQQPPAPVVPPPAQPQSPPSPVIPTSPPQPSAPDHQYGAPFQPPAPHKNKLKLILIAAAAVVAAGIVAFFLFTGGKTLVNKISGIELEKYSNTNFAFTIQVPKGWTPKEKDEEYFKEVSFNEPVGDIEDKSEANTHYASMVVSYRFADKDYLEKDEQEYFDYLRKGLQQAINRQDEKQDDKESSGSDYKEKLAKVESEGMTEVNGLKAYKVKLKVTNFKGKKDDVGYEYGLFVYVDSKNQYEINLSAHESESVNKKADEILTSFAKS